MYFASKCCTCCFISSGNSKNRKKKKNKRPILKRSSQNIRGLRNHFYDTCVNVLSHLTWCFNIFILLYLNQMYQLKFNLFNSFIIGHITCIQCLHVNPLFRNHETWCAYKIRNKVSKSFLVCLHQWSIEFKSFLL